MSLLQDYYRSELLRLIKAFDLNSITRKQREFPEKEIFDNKTHASTGGFPGE
jgi:hypothetical protein